MTCWIVDTDVYWDDLGALALLLPRRNVVAVVATGGISSPQQGIGTLGLFISIGSSNAAILQGKGAALTPAEWQWDWVPKALVYTSKLEPELRKAAPNIKKIAAANQPLLSGIAEATHNCENVGVLMIGPWTSYGDYEEAIDSKLSIVVALGSEGGTNCVIDKRPCETSKNKLGHRLRQVSNQFFGSFEFDSYAPNSPPMSLALRKLSTEFGTARELGQWDMLAALLILRPDLFQFNSNHEFLPLDEQQAKSAANQLLAADLQNESH